MITKISEYKHSLVLTLEPETVDDLALLLRFGMNALAEKPDVYVSFDDKPYCSIMMRKRNENIQITGINPNFKRK